MRKQNIAFMFAAMLFIVFGMMAGNASSIVLAQEPDDLHSKRVASGFIDDIPLTMVVDVATDARTFRLNNGLTLPEARRGDVFIVEGKIYPAGTLPVGGTLLSPGSFNPDLATGSIGKWVLRGTLNYDFGEIIGGAGPAVFGTQYFIFNDGKVLVTDGPHGAAVPQLRVLMGGGGAMSGASGDVREEVIGTNVTGLFNQRFTFKIKKQSLK